MNYEMRNLQATDIFSVVKILNGIGLNNVKEAIDFEEINNIRKGMTEGNADVITSQVGLKVVMSLVTVIIQKDEFKDFFKRASKLIK